MVVRTEEAGGCISTQLPRYRNVDWLVGIEEAGVVVPTTRNGKEYHKVNAKLGHPLELRTSCKELR